MDYKTALKYAVLAQEVYQTFPNVKFSDWQGIQPVLIEKKSTDTQLAIVEDSAQDLAVIVFRGSDHGQDWLTNFKSAVVENKDLIYPDAYSKSDNPVKMHKGFVAAYLAARDDIHAHIKKSLQNGGAKRYVTTGHSLGGALATLCAVDLQYNFGQQITLEAYTFGSPRVGNKAFAESYNRRMPNTWRVVNGWDAVVGVPTPWQSYRHVEKAIKLSRRFTWRIVTGSLEDHRISNYIQSLRSRI